jgi:hypothetical protein
MYGFESFFAHRHSGTFYRYDAKAIGSGSEGAQAELQNEFHKSLTLPEAGVARLVSEFIRDGPNLVTSVTFTACFQASTIGLSFKAVLYSAAFHKLTATSRREDTPAPVYESLSTTFPLLHALS